MLLQFLQNNKDEILRMTEEQTLELAGTRPSSAQLRSGLPIFFDQLVGVIRKVGSSGRIKRKK